MDMVVKYFDPKKYQDWLCWKSPKPGSKKVLKLATQGSKKVQKVALFQTYNTMVQKYAKIGTIKTVEY